MEWRRLKYWKLLVRDLKMLTVFHKKMKMRILKKGGVEDQAGMTRWYYQRVNFSDNILAGKLTKFWYEQRRNAMRTLWGTGVAVGV